MEVIIPCAGEGRRFAQEGYTTIKQLLEIKNKTVLDCLVQNFMDATTPVKFTFIFQKKHLDQYCSEIDAILQSYGIEYRLLQIDGLTDGAVNTALIGCSFIDVNDELIIANSDQWIKWDIKDFLHVVHAADADGAMPIFNNPERENKWSFVSIDDSGNINEVRAKDAFTPHAVVGIYYFKTGMNFIRYGTRMIELNKRVNNEFYVCPVYNEMIADGAKVVSYYVDHMVALGTPVDYEAAKQSSVLSI